jgi:hypothetical protein
MKTRASEWNGAPLGSPELLLLRHDHGMTQSPSYSTPLEKLQGGQRCTISSSIQLQDMAKRRNVSDLKQSRKLMISR